MCFIPEFLLLFFVHRIFLEYSFLDESDGYNEGESDKLGSEYGSPGMFGTGLGGLLLIVGFPLGVTLSSDETFYGVRGSLGPFFSSVTFCVSGIG